MDDDIAAELILEVFRLKYRMFLLERLALRLAFLTLASRQDRTSGQSRQRLQAILEQETELADQMFAQKFAGDPARTALYADEAQEIVSSLVSLLMSLPDPSFDVFCRE